MSMDIVPDPEVVQGVLHRLRSEAARCGLVSEAAQPDPTLRTLFEGFAYEIATMRSELERSLEQNRHNLLSQFLGLGVRRQPAQALVAVLASEAPTIDEELRLTGEGSRAQGAERREFRVPGQFRLCSLALGGAAYTGPGGLFLLDPDPRFPVRSNPILPMGEFSTPGPPCLHFGLRGTPPRGGEILSLAVVPPEEGRSRLARQGPELLSYRRWLCAGSMYTGDGRPLEPPQRIADLGRDDAIADAVSDRLPTARAAFRTLLERHLHAELILAWPGPLGDLMRPGPPPEALRRGLDALAPDRIGAWGEDLRWLTLRLSHLPVDDASRLFKRVAVNVLPAIAYEVLPVECYHPTGENIHAGTGMLPLPLGESTHALLQADDWVVDRVECTGEQFPHIHEHPDPDGNWYGLVSDWRSSTLYLHPAMRRAATMGAVNLHLGRLVGEEANGSVLDSSPYNRTAYPGVEAVAPIVEFAGGGSMAGASAEAMWEGIGSFLRTRDRLITRWDYESFILRFDPRIVRCRFENAALPRQGRFVPGIAITVHFDRDLVFESGTMEVSVTALARELERRATLGTHVDVLLGDPENRGGGDR